MCAQLRATCGSPGTQIRLHPPEPPAELWEIIFFYINQLLSVNSVHSSADVIHDGEINT